MIGLYLIIAYSFALFIFLNKNAIINNILISLFLVLQWSLTIYSCFQLNETINDYFTIDSLGILLLLTLSIICIPSFIHSYLYLKRHNETVRSRNIYFASLVILITSITAGYLANHIAVTWIFTELTTLSASAIIYHHRNKLALEGTWKYVFICAISITFVFVGILFLSLSLKNTGSEDLSFSNLILNADKLNIF